MVVYAGKSWSENSGELVMIPDGVVFKLVEHGELDADGSGDLPGALRSVIGSPTLEVTGGASTLVSNHILTMHPSNVVAHLVTSAEDEVDWVEWDLGSSQVSLCTDVASCGDDHHCDGFLGRLNGDKEIVLLVGVITEVIPEVPDDSEIDLEALDQLMADLKVDDEDESPEGVAESEESQEQEGKTNESPEGVDESEESQEQEGKTNESLEELLDTLHTPDLSKDSELDSLLRSLAEDSRVGSDVQEAAGQLRVQSKEELIDELLVMLENSSDVPPPNANDDIDQKINALRLSMERTLERLGNSEVEVEGEAGGSEREVEVDREVEGESEEVRTEHEPETVAEHEEGEERAEHEPEVVRTEADRDADRLAEQLRGVRMAFFDTAKELSGARLRNAVDLLLQKDEYEDALATIDDNQSVFADMFEMAQFSSGPETELLRITQLRSAIVDSDVSDYLAEKVKDANKAALDGTSNKGTAPIRVAGELMLIGDNHARRPLLYWSLRPGSQQGTVTVIKGGAFSPGKLTVKGITDNNLQAVVRESVASFSKKPVTFEA